MKKNDFFFIYLFFIQIYLSCDDRRVLCYFHGLCPISKKVYEHYSYQRAPRKIYWSHSYQLTEWWRRSRPIIFPSYTHPVLLLSSISIYCDLSPSYMGTLCFSPFIHQSPFFFLAKIIPICHIRTSCLVLFSFLSVCVFVPLSPDEEENSFPRLSLKWFTTRLPDNFKFWLMIKEIFYDHLVVKIWIWFLRIMDRQVLSCHSLRHQKRRDLISQTE